jgi:hypothetical protein
MRSWRQEENLQQKDRSGGFVRPVRAETAPRGKSRLPAHFRCRGRDPQRPLDVDCGWRKPRDRDEQPMSAAFTELRGREDRIGDDVAATAALARR